MRWKGEHKELISEMAKYKKKHWFSSDLTTLNTLIIENIMQMYEIKAI